MRIVVLVAYVLLMTGVLIFSARKKQTLHDFFLGGGKAGPWLSAFSYGTAYFSAVIIIGYAGKLGWEHGLSAIWIGLGNAFLGNMLAWLLLAGRANKMARELDVVTMPGFFEKRYQSRNMGLFSAVMIFVFLVPYSASVFTGMGYLFEAALGLPFFWCIMGISMLAAIYLFAGGYRATLLSDFIQGCIMIGGIILLVFFVVRGASFNPETGAYSGLMGALSRMGEIGGDGFNKLFGQQGKGLSLFMVVILTSLGTWGLPHMMHKFFAIRDAHAAKRATVISTAFCVLIAGGAYFSGSFGKQILGGIAPEGGLDRVMPNVILSGVVGIPDAIIGLIVVLILSASVSTLTSLVLSSASAIAIDLCGALLPSMKPARQTLLLRVLCVVFVIFSLVITFGLQGTPIVTLMSFSWGTLSGAFLAPFVFGLYWRKTTRAGAAAGMLVGALVSILTPLLHIVPSTVYGGVCAMAASLIVVPAVSLLTQKSSKLKTFKSA